MSNAKFGAILVVGYTLLFPISAHAYLDQGTGSYIMQMFGAGFFVGAFVIKTSWGKIKGFTQKLSGKGEKKIESKAEEQS